jgi:hypothetical protein
MEEMIHGWKSTTEFPVAELREQRLRGEKQYFLGEQQYNRKDESEMGELMGKLTTTSRPFVNTVLFVSTELNAESHSGDSLKGKTKSCKKAGLLFTQSKLTQKAGHLKTKDIKDIDRPHTTQKIE